MGRNTSPSIDPGAQRGSRWHDLGSWRMPCVPAVNDTEEKAGASPDIPREKSQWNGLIPPKIVNPSSSQKQDDSFPWNGLDPPKPASLLVDRESFPWNGLDPPTPVRAVKPVGGTVCEPCCSNNKEKQEQESCAAFTVNILVGDRSVDAIVGTAAEVTVISEDLFHSLSPRPSIIGKRHLNMAGKNQSSKAKLAGPVHIRLGPLVSQETVYVAPIKDDMLLGVDYLNKHAAEINFEDHTIQVRGVKTPHAQFRWKLQCQSVSGPGYLYSIYECSKGEMYYR